MTTPPDEADEDTRTCKRCNLDFALETYALHSRTITFCSSCDADAHATFERQAELRDFCWSCGHVHPTRTRKCSEPSCSCDGHMTHTRSTVLGMMLHGLPLQIVTEDGSQAVDAYETVCARCGCPNFRHANGSGACAGCGCAGVVRGLARADAPTNVLITKAPAGARP